MAADPPGLASRALAQGADWAVWEVNCTLGPRDRPFEERHAFTSIAAVVRGTFQYRSPQGSELLYPGSLLLGNAGTCFECGHQHGTGDRCVAFGFAPALFEEIAASAGGTSKYRFRAPRLPVSAAMTPSLAMAEASATGLQGQDAEELAIGLAERVVRATSAFVSRAGAPSARDVRRVADALRFIDAHYAEPLDLARLAEVARMSKYHFLRTFRRVVAVTPHQYVLTLRLRRSAARLSTSDEPVLAVASDAGFGDLSTFYAHFRRAFGASPQAHRRSARAAPARR
jgi:AraC-like DNA-binding protein